MLHLPDLAGLVVEASVLLVGLRVLVLRPFILLSNTGLVIVKCIPFITRVSVVDTMAT